MIIGMGHDLVELGRIQKILQGAAGPSFVARVLTPQEKAHAVNKFGDQLHGRWIEYVAGRFAVKEAVVKAFGCGIGAIIGFQDMSVLPDTAGKPVCELSLTSYEKLGLDPQVVYLHVSITHTQQLASACAIVEQFN